MEGACAMLRMHNKDMSTACVSSIGQLVKTYAYTGIYTYTCIDGLVNLN